MFFRHLRTKARSYATLAADKTLALGSAGQSLELMQVAGGMAFGDQTPPKSHSALREFCVSHKRKPKGANPQRDSGDVSGDSNSVLRGDAKINNFFK
jgi:hypothetical protein